jgi:diketogulonate reductase-like aldo/keto reductase
MGQDRAKRKTEVAALQAGLDLGLGLIDTAEMYGEGGAEEVIGQAIAGRRDEVFLVSKVYPHNASLSGAVAACERSLRRLKSDYLDLYLLHWRGSVPVAETLEAFQALERSGKIRAYGVSNFDLDDMVESSALPGGARIAVDQVLYNLSRRGIEWDLLRWCRERDIAVMAYTPIEQGRILAQKQLVAVAARRRATPAQVALAWLLTKQGVVVIPKAATLAHVTENRAALDLILSAEDLSDLDLAFPPPKKKKGLEML